MRLRALFARKLQKGVILHRFFLLFGEILFLFVQLSQLRMVVCQHNTHAQYFIGGDNRPQKILAAGIQKKSDFSEKTALCF